MEEEIWNWEGVEIANWVEAVGVDSVEMQEGCVEDERRVRDVMESRRRRKWKCILSG